MATHFSTILKCALPQYALDAMQAWTMRSPTCFAVTRPVAEIDASALSLTPQDHTACGASGLEACIWREAVLAKGTPSGATNTVSGSPAGGPGATGTSPEHALIVQD